MKKLFRTILFTLAATLGLGAAENIRTTLQKAGLNPALADELAPGKDVTVYATTPKDIKKLRTALVRMFGEKNARDMDPELADEMNGANTFRDRTGKKKECVILIDKKKFTEDPYSFLVPFGMSPAVNYKWALTHELAHCDGNQVWTPDSDMENEADSDKRAAQALEASGYKGVLEAIILLRAYNGAMTLGNQHDTALYLDAVRQGIEPPSFLQVRQANNEAYPVLRNLFRQHVDRQTGFCSGKKRAALCAYDPENDMKSLSPRARRRVELFQQARDRVKM